MFGGENFPYTNFHDLNTDWIIKVAKNFLDTYSNWEQRFEDQKDELQALGAQIESQLNEWYNTHSDDIAEQLANSLMELNNHLTTTIAAFNTAADAKKEEVLESLPDDYIQLDNDVNSFKGAISEGVSEYIFEVKNWGVFSGKWIDGDTGEEKDDVGSSASGFIPLPRETKLLTVLVNMPHGTGYNAFYDENKNYLSKLTWDGNVIVPANAKYIRVSTSASALSNLKFKAIKANQIVVESTFGFQGQLSYGNLEADNSLIVTATNNVGGNFAYIMQNISNSNLYVAADPTYTIPRYGALVLSLDECIAAIVGGRKATLTVRAYEGIKPSDIIVLKNGHDSTGLEISGIWEEQKILHEVDAHNDDNIMRSICRFGEAYGSPETPGSIIACHKAGFNIVRVNLQFTSDGVPVLWHDQYLNQYYQDVWDLNGNLVVYTPDTGISIQNSTLAQLNRYRFGRKSNDPGIPQLEPVLSVCRKLGMELVLEGKQTFTEEQIQTVYGLIGKYGMVDKTSICAGSITNAPLIARNAPLLRVGVQSQTLDTQTRTVYQELSQISKRLFWWGWNTTTLTKAMVDFITQYGIEFECGDFTSYTQIDNYLSSEYAYCCRGMEIQGSISPFIGQYIYNKVAN